MTTTTPKSVLERYPEYEAVIGIEIHVQLKTKTKLFCACANKFGADANVNTCEVCLGLLGTLPVLNKRAVDYAIKAGLAMNCTISRVSDFARKHYMYPDLPKNYQITQYEKPICLDGYIAIEKGDGVEKKVRIHHIHMEEDAGKNFHSNLLGGCTLVDFNRAGAPLIEIVSEPDMSSPQEAVDYLEKVRAIVMYLDIGTGNMEEGSFRADINISVRPRGQAALGTKTELKNINSFRFIEMASEYEIERQINAVQAGEKIRQETRSWDEKERKTFMMRSKEDSQDYRYFPDPDLPILIIDPEWVERMESEIPELPNAKFKRFQENFGVSAYESNILVEKPEIADLFEKACIKSKLPKVVANWILRDLLGYMKETKTDFADLKITAETLSELVIEVERGVISNTVAREIFVEMAKTGAYPSIIIQQKGLKQISDVDQLQAVVQQIAKDYPTQFAEFQGGNDRILGFLVGKAMAMSGGKANPRILNELFFKLKS